MSALSALSRALSREGGLLAAALRDPPGAEQAPSPPELAAGGPRTAAERERYELALEAIYEGYLLHYAAPRLFVTDDPDLDLLAGDRLYALGIEQLVALGDLEAVAELADVISLCAVAHARNDPALAAAVWHAGAVAIGWGGSAAHEQAKRRARGGGDGGRAQLLEASARQSRA